MVVKEESQIRPVGPYDFSTLLVDPPRFSAFRRADSFEKDLGNASDASGYLPRVRRHRVATCSEAPG